jgi:hypothetical protein
VTRRSLACLGESITFMAIAVGLLVIALVVFAAGIHALVVLVIGIISATRDILTVGAELSLVGEQTPLMRTMTELGVNAGVGLALSVALVLVRRLARLNHV